MKRLLLSVSVLAMSLGTVFAQTHSTLAGNAPTSDGKGYTFNFNGSGANNCLAGGGVANNGGVLNQTWTVNGGNLIVTVPTMTHYDDTRQVLKFYGGDCVASTIDLSNSANKKLSFKVNSSPANTSTTTSRQLVIIFYNSDGSQTNYNNNPNIVTLTTGSNVYSGNVDLTGISVTGTILQLGMFIRGAGTTPWNDFDAAGTYTFEYFAIGNATIPSSISTTTTTSSVAGLFFNDDNQANLVSVYPNPATDNVTVDLSALPGNNTVKLINATGSVVSEQTANGSASFGLEGLTKGIYFLQISSESKVVRKKVMIE